MLLSRLLVLSSSSFMAYSSLRRTLIVEATAILKLLKRWPVAVIVRGAA